MNTIYKMDYNPPVDDDATLYDIWRLSLIERASQEIQINLFDYHFKTTEHLHLEGEPVFSISVFYCSEGVIKLDGGLPIPIKPDLTCLFYAPHTARGECQFTAGTHLRCVEFRYSISLIEQLNITTLPTLLDAYSCHYCDQDVLISTLQTTLRMKNIGQTVLNCKMSGTARKVFLQAKALEALAYIVNSSNCEERVFPYSGRDQTRVEEATRLLQEHYKDNWTIHRLAKAVGLNQKKLKIGFRVLNGITINKYLENRRLDMAAEMLANGAKVIETTHSVGYNSPSHFAKIFRRSFGQSPKNWQGRVDS